MKRIFIYLFYYPVAVLVVLLFLEFSIRFFAPGVQPSGTSASIVADSIYFSNYGLKPNSHGYSNGIPVEIDLFGCRSGSVIPDTTLPGWLYIGDSVTFGLGVKNDSTFAAKVNKTIDTVRIYNPSVVGYGIDSYLNTLRYYLLKKKLNYNIKSVTLFWCLNDVYEYISDQNIPGGGLRKDAPELIRFLKRNSRLYQVLKALFFDRPRDYYLFDSSFYKVDNPYFQHALKVVKEMSALCRREQVDFKIVLLPYEYQLRYNDYSPQNLLIKNLVPLLIKIDNPFQNRHFKDPRKYYLYGDGIHFSNRGHDFISNYLISQIKRHSNFKMNTID